MSNLLKKALFISLAVVAVPLAGRAEDLNEIFKRVNDLIAQKNYPKALDELGWAKKEIEKMNSNAVQTYLPDSLGGFTGGKTTVNNAMGMMNIERPYTKGDATVKVSLVGGSGGGAMGGLAAMGKMAAMFGGGEGQETVRIQGRTAMLKTSSAEPELQIFLDSGSVLTFNAESGMSGTDLKAMAEAMKLDDLDKYLRGQAG